MTTSSIKSTTTGPPMTIKQTVMTSVVPTSTPVPSCTPQLSSNGTLFSVTNPTSSNYPNDTCYAYTWIATDSSATFSFFFRQDHGGWMLDDVNIYYGSTQLINNGGFETGDLTGWTQSGSCSGGMGDALNEISSSVTGSYCYYDPCQDYGDTISQTFPTVAGDTYLISFWLTNYICCSPTEMTNITIN